MVLVANDKCSVQTLLDDLQIDNSSTSDDIIYEFDLQTPEGIPYKCTMSIYDNLLLLVITYPWIVNTCKKTEMLICLNNINRELHSGCLEFDQQRRMLQYRTSLVLTDSTPTVNRMKKIYVQAVNEAMKYVDTLRGFSI